ncbi:uncharacterized protein N7515_010010 [Penicillium bovifimosum]|uniref:DUF985 domain-containing protein n=1 Tax=Penicillium bovifimosum TaxID=126998 RepID=A0A9W9KUP4_9EURO|nr:uncharacterized protein N7515_010010 [Penicillium bovifimosum]KAJ5120622.1 hypothetical protein N7515_010010 [Penicillium bovifimosum]
MSNQPNLKPLYPPHPSQQEPEEESPQIQKTVDALSLLPHPEGGYYVETDRDPLRIPNPFAPTSDTDKDRSASTTIFYLLTPNRSFGAFHRNKGRTVHVWQRGRGRYVIIHADEVEGGKGKARVETFVVGPDVAAGERMQWVVEGGKYKASFLLEDGGSGESKEGLLISEVVVPGFEFADHDFLRREKMEELLTEEQVREMDWMLRVE